MSPSSRHSMLHPIALLGLAASFTWAPNHAGLSQSFHVSALSTSPSSTISSSSSTNAKHSTGASAAMSMSSPLHRRTKRIAVVGAGAVGSYYGGRLWEGHNSAIVRTSPSSSRKSDDDDDDDDAIAAVVDVMFQLRNENYDHCAKRGIDVSSHHGDFSIPAEELMAFRTTDDMARSVVERNSRDGDDDEGGDDHRFDWVVCALKSTSLDEVPKLIEPLLSPETRVLVLMNGLVEEDLIRTMRERRELRGLKGVGCKAVYGGMALICSNRPSPGKISHTYGGKLVAGVAYSADANDDDTGEWVESDRRAILDLFEPATAVPFEFEPNLRRGRWWKNVWNLPFSGISVSMGGITVDRIVDDPSLRKLAYRVIDETIAIANADLAKHGCAEGELLGDETRDEMMTLSDNMGPYNPSTMLDLHARKPMEVKYLFRKAVDRADDLGVDCPHLETLVCHIEAHQRHHNLF